MKLYRKILIGITVLSAIAAYVTYQKFFSDGVLLNRNVETQKERAKEAGDEQLSELKEGDILFQISQSGQSRAIQLATGSKYSHCGILLENEGELMVLEAVQPVKYTPLDEWIKRGKDSHYVVKRWVGDEQLNDSVLCNMRNYGKTVLGKNYDSYFEWSDDKIYCSELVWKIYKEAARVELTQLETMQDFDLTNKEVKAKLKERFGNNLPTDEKVVSPKAIFDSELLSTVTGD